MTDTKFSLYYYDQCPFCQRVLHAIRQTGVQVELRNTLKDPQHRQDLAQGGGRTTVPCLRIQSDSSDEWMYESMDIVNYLKSVA